MECRNNPSRWTRLALVLLAVGCLALPAAAQDRSQGLGLGPAQGGYDYPVRPGTETWKALATHDEMVQATQVDESVLGALSDRALLRTVLDYPLLSEVMFYDSPQAGFDAVRAQFRGLDALLERPGMPEVLLRRYQRTDAANVPAVLSLVEQGRRSGRLAFIELLLAQPEVLAGMSDALREELLLETLLKREQKLERFDVYALPGLERTAFTAARALGPAEEGEMVLRQSVGAFLETGTAPTVEVLDAVFARAEAAVLGVTSPSLSERVALATKDYNSTVKTPNDSVVSVIVMTWEFSSGDIASCNAWLDQTYPSATRLTNCSRKYNCHSYAWYSQSTSNNKWMNTPGDDKYWQDGSYVSAVLTPGCKASYASDDHSAHIVSSSVFRSKWGSTAVMAHAPTYTPYDSSDLDYYCRASTVTVTGPSSRDPNQSGTWYCGVTGVGLQPYTYSWFKSWAGGGYADLGTGTSKSTSHSTSFNIVCDVVDASGRFLGTDFQFVDVDGDPGGPIIE